MAQIQIAARGAQDIYLTDNPEISFFRYSFKRHSNFSIESYDIDFVGKKIKFNNNNNIKLERHGDLLSKIYIKLKIRAKNTNKRWAWVDNLGYNLINFIEFKIGDNIIDKIYGTWLNIWNELSLNNNLRKAQYEINGNIDNKIMKDVNDRDIQLFIPLNFFFCKDYGSSLPLISLQNVELSLNINLNKFEDCINHDHGLIESDWDTIPTIIENKLLVDYIFLDNEERNIFAKSNHEMLIEYLDFDHHNLNSNNNFYNLDFKINNLVKSMYFTVTLNKYTDINNQKNKFLAENKLLATKRFCLIALCGTDNVNTQINIVLKSSFSIKIDTDNTIKFYDNVGNLIATNIVTKLNSNYQNYQDLKDVIENCYIQKNLNIDSLSIDNIDDSYLKCNKLLDNFTYSLNIEDLIQTSDTDTTKPFSILNRSNVSGGYGLSKYDVCINKNDNYGLYLNKKTKSN